jgi:uncharacterized Zn ribbon protein
MKTRCEHYEAEFLIVLQGQFVCSDCIRFCWHCHSAFDMNRSDAGLCPNCSNELKMAARKYKNQSPRGRK